ncbi:cell division protein FtsA [Maribellus sp. CM-23]|uniref:cell division protein FtsA n=1 Tax=Maribellus sp. CM-23 TaxID=2781026 RepID=UPI001F490EA4|nr:cell division protein FtsA [Maribellus sp. CM-23]MCE4563270.1 cell division protein FtsA [Maribellus sp. CM-23]
MASKQNFSVVVDLGTSKMVALAGKLTELGKMEILGTAQISSKGIKRGVIVNIEEAAEALGDLLDLLENQLDEKPEQVHVAFAGSKMQTIDYRATSLTSGEGFVTAPDVQRLLDEAERVEIQQDYKVVQVIPTSYIIDDEHEVEKPVGSTGRKIEAHFKLVVMPTQYVNNLKLVFDKAGFELGEIVHASLAVSEAVLSSEEKEVGVIVMDFGAGTTNIAVFQDNVLKHTAVVPFGGQVVTNDIKEGCSIFLKKAELLKVKYGQAMGDFADEQKVVTIAGENGWEPRDISFKSLAYIIQARLEEIIECVNIQIEKSGIENNLGSGIVITGGTAKLDNMISLVKFKTAMDARNAHPVIHPVNRKEEFRNPELFTALGTLKLMLSSTGTGTVTERVQVKSSKKKERRFGPLFKDVVQGALNLFDTDGSDAELN